MKSGMKLKAVAAVVLGLAIAGCGGGGDGDGDVSSNGSSSTPQSGALSSGGAEYLNQTSQSTQSQAEQSQAAAQKSTTPAVKELANRVNTEVTIINQQITNISQTNNVTINNKLTNEQQTQINNLNNLSGNEFDRAYVNNLVNLLRQELAATIRQVREGKDAQVRQIAASNVLVIEQRLVVAQQILFILEPTQYLVGAYEDNQLEVELGRVALQKATTEQVRQFAQKMVDDHTQVNTQISSLAAQKGVTLPTQLGPDKQEIIASISAFSGVDFDKAFMDRNVQLHAESVSKASVVAQQSTDAEIKAFAAQTLPTLQAHFQESQTIATSIQASALYQLAQSLVSELQLAQAAQTRGGNQGATLGQNIAQQNQVSFVQVVQVAQQQNAQIPLAISASQAQTVLQLLQDSGTDFQGIQSLITAQLTQSLQIAQSLQGSSEPGIGNIATNRVGILQNLNKGGSQGISGTGNTSSSGTDGAGSGTGATGGTGDAGSSGGIDGTDGSGTGGGTSGTGSTSTGSASS